jgi:hypothetical protein
MLSPSQVAFRLTTEYGRVVDRHQVYKAVLAGRIPARLNGKHWLVDESALPDAAEMFPRNQ